MSEIKNGGLDQYGAEPFEQQQFGTTGIEGVNVLWRENGPSMVFDHIVLIFDLKLKI